MALGNPRLAKGSRSVSLPSFFFNDTATTEIYTLSLHDALPIWLQKQFSTSALCLQSLIRQAKMFRDRKSTRLNSSHRTRSYAVFCLKKKNTCDLQPGSVGDVHGYSITTRASCSQ